MNNKSIFKNYVDWPENFGTVYLVMNWMKETFSYMIEVKKNKIKLKAVEEITTGPWSAFSFIRNNNTFFYFKNDIDVVAFKLKFL